MSRTSLYGFGLRGGPVGEWRLGGDEGVDLFELDDVGPVGDDPVAPGVLGAGGGEEVVVHLGGVEVGAGEPVDEGALVGWRGGMSCSSSVRRSTSSAGERTISGACRVGGGGR